MQNLNLKFKLKLVVIHLKPMTYILSVYKKLISWQLPKHVLSCKYQKDTGLIIFYLQDFDKYLRGKCNDGGN